MEKVQVCDSKPLKECLDRNNNDRSKCLKEWNDFQKACREKKLQANDKSECTTCKET